MIRSYALFKLQNHPYIYNVYLRAAHVGIADLCRAKHKEHRAGKFDSENIGNAIKLHACPSCKKHTWLVLKNTSHVF